MTGVALITGAAGLVGSHIAERLLADGWTVRALSRSPARDRWLESTGLELHEGDVLRPDTLHTAARGCTHLFHCAAAITARGGWDSFHATNVQGTANVVAAAAGSSARLLQLSSVAVYGPTARFAGPTVTEQMVLAPLDDSLHYARTKRESERIALQAHARGEVWAAAIRPCVIYGRRDRQFVPRLARLLRRGIVPLPAGGRTPLSIIHAASVAAGAILAATSDIAGGKSYNIANERPVTGREFFQLAGDGLGRRVRVVPVPVWLARAGIAAGQMVIRLTHGRGAAAMSSGSLGFLTRGNPFSSERARRELGWSPVVDPASGIPDAFRWARDHAPVESG